MSLRQGDTLRFFISTNPDSEYTMQVYRPGYYQGKRGTQKMDAGTFRGKIQPDPKPPGTGACREIKVTWAYGPG